MWHPKLTTKQNIFTHNILESPQPPEYLCEYYYVCICVRCLCVCICCVCWWSGKEPVGYKEKIEFASNSERFILWNLFLFSPLSYIIFFKLKYSWFFLKLIHLFIYFWLCWVFVSVRGLSLAAASGGHSSSRCAGLSLSRPLLLRSTGSRRAGSVVVAHGTSCSAACGIFPDQGSNPCPLYWQADSQPPRHQGSPKLHYFLISTSAYMPYEIWSLLVFLALSRVYSSGNVWRYD